MPTASANIFLHTLLGDDPSLASLNQLLIQRTEGNPFFLEESVRTLVETGVLVGKPGAYRLEHALLTLPVPATVQAVLAARIDRLAPEEKYLLQTAAVIGTEVPLVLLQAVMELPEGSLRLGLMQLQDAEFLHEMSLFPELVYTFKHALTQEVAYGSLLHERRRVLHTRIVAALEALVGEQVAEQVERLAHHALRGEVWSKVLAYCRQAGDKALARSAHREAIGYFEQALSALPHLSATRATLEPAIDIRLDLRNALWTLGEFERLFTNLQEAEALAETLGDQHRLGWVSVYLLAHFAQVCDPDRALMSGQRALEIATALGDIGLTVVVQHYLGGVYRSLGDYSRAVEYSKRTWRVSTGRCCRSVSVCLVWPRCSPAVTSSSLLRSAVPLPRGRHPLRKGCRLPRQPIIPTAVSWRIGPWAFGRCARVTCSGPSPCSNGPSTSRRRHTSGSSFPSLRRPWGQRMRSPGGPLTLCCCWSRRLYRPSRCITCGTMRSGWSG